MTDDFRRPHLQEMPHPDTDLEEAFGLIVEKRNLQSHDAVSGCTSYVQRKLKCGYNHAAYLLQRMEELFWVTATDDRGARKIIRRADR